MDKTPPEYFRVKLEAWERAKKEGMKPAEDIPTINIVYERGLGHRSDIFRFPCSMWSWSFNDCDKVTEEEYLQYRKQVKEIWDERTKCANSGKTKA